MALVIPDECGEMVVIDEQGRRVQVLRGLGDSWIAGIRKSDWSIMRVKSRYLPTCDTYEDMLGNLWDWAERDERRRIVFTNEEEEQ